MNVQRGDVVLVPFPYTSAGGAKLRPALVVQNDRDNRRLVNTIVAQITSVTHRALEATQLLIDLHTPDGQQSGLRQDSVVNCVNLLTLSRSDVLRVIGRLPPASMQRVTDCLKVALDAK